MAITVLFAYFSHMIIPNLKDQMLFFVCSVIFGISSAENAKNVDISTISGYNPINHNSTTFSGR